MLRQALSGVGVFTKCSKKKISLKRGRGEPLDALGRLSVGMVGRGVMPQMSNEENQGLDSGAQGAGIGPIRCRARPQP